MKTFEEERDEVRAAILAAQAETQKANAAAEKAEAARSRASEAERRAWELENARQRQEAEQRVAGYPQRTAAIHKAIAEQEQAFRAAVAASDMDAVLRTYRAWRAERSRLYLAWRQQSDDKSTLGMYGPSGPVNDNPPFSASTPFLDMLAQTVEQLVVRDSREMEDAD